MHRLALALACALAAADARIAVADLVGDEVEGQITNLTGDWALESLLPGGQFDSPATVGAGDEFSGQVDDPNTLMNFSQGVTVTVDLAAESIAVALFGSVTAAGAGASWDIELTDLDWGNVQGEIVGVTETQTLAPACGTFALLSFGPHSVTFRVTADASGCFDATGATPGQYDLQVEHFCTIFNDEATFVAAVTADGKLMKGVEDFEPPVSNIGPGQQADLDDPLTGGVANVEAGSGLGFPAGLAAANLTLQSNPVTASPPTANPGAGLTVVGRNVFAPAVPSSVKVGAEVFSQSLDLIFDPSGAAKTGVGLTIENPTSGTAHVAVYDLADTLLYEGTLAVARETFFGIRCPDGIGRINVGGPGAELVDEIQMWEEVLCPADGNCFLPNGTPGCQEVGCCEVVCAIFPQCCDVTWDQLCADTAQSICGNAACPGTGDCYAEHATPGCDDSHCCKTVCLIDVFCCNNNWDSTCVDEARQFCFCPGDTNADGVVDVNDLNNVILDWGTDGSVNGGDITDQSGTGPPDGFVDVNDLNAIFVNWGPC